MFVRRADINFPLPNPPTPPSPTSTPGRLSLGSDTSADSVRQRPPPPYKPPQRPSTSSGIVGNDFVAQTTTTLVTTTQTTATTTTQFFPIFRRKGTSNPGSGFLGIGVQDATGSRPVSVLLLDKELPALPPNSPDSKGPFSTPRNSLATNAPTTTISGPQTPSPPRPHLQSTSMLAHASLGLGLPPVISFLPPSPQKRFSTDIPRSSNDESTLIPSVPLPVPSSSTQSQDNRLSRALGLGRAKSFTDLRGQADNGETLEDGGRTPRADAQERLAMRRARGLSIGPSLQGFSFFRSSPDSKGKGRQVEEPLDITELGELGRQSHDGQQPQKPLSRKGSFWTRRRAKANTLNITPVSEPSPLNPRFNSLTHTTTPPMPKRATRHAFPNPITSPSSPSFATSTPLFGLDVGSPQGGTNIRKSISTTGLRRRHSSYNTHKSFVSPSTTSLVSSSVHGPTAESPIEDILERAGSPPRASTSFFSSTKSRRHRGNSLTRSPSTGSRFSRTSRARTAPREAVPPIPSSTFTGPGNLSTLSLQLPKQPRRRSFSLFGEQTPQIPRVSSPTSVTPTSPPPTPLDSPSISTSGFLFPHSGSSTRPRSQTGPSPPLFRRLSQSFFSTSSQSNANPLSGLPFPSSNASSAALSQPSFSQNDRPSMDDLAGDPAYRNHSSSVLSHSPSKVVVPSPRIDEDETPELYLGRLLQAVSKAEIAGVLASNVDAFHARALQAYIGRFDFTHDPLDVALRRLLMDVGLPKETQQIDRVMEAFARRYDECNPGLFISEDHPYILAFSLMMLHTDAFNKHNKNKMTKMDYIKNTKLPGIIPEILDCFYDNITFVPFIFIEDPMDVNGHRGFTPDGFGSGTPTTTNGNNSTMTTPSSSGFLMKPKVDPYFLITQNMLDPLRVQVSAMIPPASPYIYTGTSGSWDEKKLKYAFASADFIEIRGPERRKGSILGLGGNGNGTEDIQPDVDVRTLKVTKVGVLIRKEDLGDGGKKASNRKWREWSVVLTGSQLLFLRDPAWVSILAQVDEEATKDTIVVTAPSTFKPDEIISVNDSIALFDHTYSRYPHTFRFVMGSGRQYLMRTSDDAELDDWIAKINYASAFKTAGVRMRPAGMTGDQAMSTGAAAAVSHLNDLRRSESPIPLLLFPSIADSPDKSDRSSVERPTPRNLPALAPARNRLSRMTLTGVLDSIDPESPTILQSDGRLEDTFTHVKSELAGGRVTLPRTPGISRRDGLRATSIAARPDSSRNGYLTDTMPSTNSRSTVVRSKLKEIEARIMTAQQALDADLRAARNLAVLTPFQRSTRDRLQLAVEPVSRRVKILRIDLAKLICHRNVLAADLAAEEKEWQQLKEVALRAATNEIRSRTVSSPNPAPGPKIIPTMPDRLSKPSVAAPIISSITVPETPRPESSVYSFHSAQEFETESSRSLISPGEEVSTAPLSGSLFFNYSLGPPVDEGEEDTLNQPDASISPSRRSSGALPSGRPSFTESRNRTVSAETVSQLSHDPEKEKRPSHDEEPEEWNKTRAGKRISLVELPSNVRKLSARISRHASETGTLPERNTLILDRRVVSVPTAQPQPNGPSN